MVNLLALQTFRAFIEGGSIANAAAKVHRTESQVSRLLTSLQESVGFPILRKEGRSLVLTDEGRDFYSVVERLTDVVEEVERFSVSKRRQRLNHVRILAAPHFSEGLVGDAIARVRVINPDFTASVDTKRPVDMDAFLTRSQFDLALSQLPVEHVRFASRDIVTAEAIVVIPADHPLAEHSVIHAEELQNYPLVHQPAYSVLWSRYQALIEKSEMASSVRIEVNYGPLAAQFAGKGLGAALTDPFSALSQSHTGIIFRRLTPSITLRYGALVPLNTAPNKTVEMFISALQEVAREKLRQIERLLDA